MNDSFEALRSIMQGADVPGLRQQDCSESSHRRLLGALRGLQSGARVGRADLSVLVRHVLRREQERQRVVTQSALVPRSSSWPDRELWSRTGFDVDEHSPEFFRVQPRPWEPTWMSYPEGVSPERPLFAEDYRRNYVAASGDPFLRVVDVVDYRSVGQRISVRSVLTSPPGSTLVINLPTGAGKSLCAQLPALLQSESHGVTVVVMPTTALCLDQESAIRRLIQHPTAYYGGSTTEQRDRNAQIRGRVASGTQRIVFTSPESLVGALSHSVYKAARAGLLRFLVIDEAHMLDQWGDEFRSAFQEVAGLRVDLLRNCAPPAFRTLLLTATLTEPCLDTITTLFARPGPFSVVSAVQLRPEPAYWRSLCAGDAEKDARILDAVHHLPRPMLLYVTRIRDANTWISRIRAAGFARCSVVTGSTPDSERLQALDDWRADRVDVIVATSAFGLGVDKDDVRAVVHACVPENVDRYYQEVGRGGRDGKASMSLVLYTGDDLRVAEGMNRKKLISIQRGRERWCSMFQHKHTTPTVGRYRVPVDVQPSYELDDIDMVNDYNVAWNIRTLTLMARARMIELDADPPPGLSLADGLDPDTHLHDFDEAMAAYRSTRVVRVLRQDHQSEEAWLGGAEAERQRASHFARRSLALMREVLDARRCVADVLSGVYSIGTEGPGGNLRVWVAPACGGCHHCRNIGTAPFASPLPQPPIPWDGVRDIAPVLAQQMGPEGVLGVFYEAPHKRREERTFGEALAWFAAQGILNFLVPVPLSHIARSALEKVGVVFLSDQLDPLANLELPRAPTLIVHPPGQPVPADLYLHRPAGGGRRPARVLFVPADAMDPERDGVRLRERFRYPSLLMEELRARYSI
jgi:ATP-dependent DNA helicase RecQ